MPPNARQRVPCVEDTFFFLALLNRRDAKYHADALVLNRVDRPMVTTAWVLIELADHLCDARNRRLFKQVREALATDRRFEIVSAEQSLLDRSVDLYHARPLKLSSLTASS